VAQADAGEERISDERLPSRRRGWTSVASKWVLAATIFGSALALGSIHTPVLCVVTAGLALAAGLAWYKTDPTRPRTVASVLLFTCIGLTLYTLLQCVPMPVSLLAAIAPENADVWARCLSPLHKPGPSWAPLSLDPMATRVEVMRGVAYLLAFLATLRVAKRREGIDFVAAVIVITATALGVAALLHPAFGAVKVFGVYTPETAPYARHVAPILNPNVLAEYLSIGFCIALAAGISPRPRVPRPIAISFALVLAAIQLWVASRGGVIGMVVGAALVVGMTLRPGQEQERGRVRRSYLIFGAIGAAGVAMCVLAGSDDAFAELGERDVSKLHLFAQVLRVVRAFPVFGTGRGAFESVYPAFREGTGYYVFTHPENLVLQWATEWGVVAAVVGLGAIAWALRPQVVLARGQAVIGAWAAVLCVAVHNLVDLGTEVPGVVVALTACAAIVTGGTSGDAKASRAEAWGKRPTWLAGLAPAAALLAIVFALPSIGKDLNADRAELHDLATATTTNGDAFQSAAEGAMRRHPAEPYLPFMGALHALLTHDSVVPWAERTLERARVYGPVHLVLARSLFRSSPAQARVEYRFAMMEDPEHMGGIPKESAPLVESFDDVMEIVPPGNSGLSAISEFSQKLGARLPATQVRLDEELLRRAPELPEPTERRAASALADLENAETAPWCTQDRAACARTALERTKRVVEVLPSVCEGFRLHARALADTGETERAMTELSAAAEHVDDRSACLIHVIELAKTQKLEEKMTRAIDQLARAGCASAAECAGNLQYAAGAEASRGNLRRALAFYRKGAEQYPERDDLLAATASTAASLGLHAEALDSYIRLAKRHPGQADWDAAVTAERQALLTK
jgi:hypothetical protein